MKTQRYTAAQVVEAIKGTFGIKQVACNRLGCVHATLDNYIARYPSVRVAYEHERGRLVDMAQSKLVEMVNNGDPWAVKFVLSTLGKHEGFVERQEVTGAEGGPVGVKIYIPDNGRQGEPLIQQSDGDD